MSIPSAFAEVDYPLNGTADHAGKKKPVPDIKLDDFEQGTWKSEEPKARSNDTSQQDDYRQKFLSSILDQDKDYPLPEAILGIVHGDVETPLLTKKSCSLYQGKQKSKKTTVLAMAIAQFITSKKYPDPGNIYFKAYGDGVAMIFDTEQGESYAARTMRTILNIADTRKSSRLIYCDLRQYPPSERKQIIEAGIQATPNVQLVVIDGLVDLMNDFMDAGEGHMTATEILKLCSVYNIHIACVLHQNKADSNARAHIGSIASQKCEMEISTEVDKNDRARSIVKCINSRGMPFEEFAIRWDKGSLPKIDQGWSSTGGDVDETNTKKHKEAYHRAYGILAPPKSLSYTDAIKVLEESRGISTSTAKRWFTEFIDRELVEKGSDGNYRFKVQMGSK